MFISTEAGKKREKGGKASPDACVGRSRGGLTTKIHALTDALGNPVRMHLSAGQDSDIRHAQICIASLSVQAVIADKAYDSKDYVAYLQSRGIEVVIPSRSNSRQPRSIDKNLYKDRNKIERWWSRLKHYRRCATRYDKTARNFMAFIAFAATITWLL